jgi:molecular chaperone GrpE
MYLSFLARPWRICKRKMKQSNNKNDNNHKAEASGLPSDKQSAADQEMDALKENTVTISEEEYKKLQKEAAEAREYQDRMLRLQADFDNARKRMEKQCQDFTKYASEGIIAELLTILDDLERTTQVAENKGANLETFLKGIEMILSHLYEMLKAHGVKPTEVVGKPFDPHTSEALMQIESELPENVVVEEMQKGYYLNDRVIRTAKVKVAKKKDSV